MAQETNDNSYIKAPKTPDTRNMKFVSGASQPWSSVAEAHAAITYKSRGVPIYIDIAGKTVEHQYQGGLAQVNLTPFNQSTSSNTSFLTGTLDS